MNELFLKIGYLAWFFLPAALANAMPVVAAKLPYLRSLSFPLDGGMIWKGKRLLGEHKTIRGIVVGMLTGVAFVTLQRYLYDAFPAFFTFGPFDYGSANPIGLGLALGLGPLVGDAIKSFFKRQQNIESGDMWFPFDQIDYILGAIVFSLPFYVFPVVDYVVIIVVGFLANVVTNFVSHRVGLKAVPY